MDKDQAARIRQKAVEKYDPVDIFIGNPDGSDAYVEPADYGAWVAAMVWVSHVDKEEE